MSKMNIRFQFGANDCDISIEKGDTVGDIFDMFKDNFSIPNDSVPYVNDEKVTKSHKLTEGEKLEFKKETGRKG